MRVPPNAVSPQTEHSSLRFFHNAEGRIMSILLIFEVFLANAATRALALGCAFWLVAKPLARSADALLAAACGFLLTMALTHLLPEAFEAAGADPHRLGLAMLLTVAVFLVLGRLIGAGHVGHDHADCGPAPAQSLPGLFSAAALHGFVDGVLIATTFLVSERAGWLAALAVLAHELPQQAGFLVILRSAGKSSRTAVLFCLGTALAAVLGGFAGLAAVGFFEGLLPYALAMSAASFTYITLFALLPEAFEGCAGLRANLARFALVFAGGALSLLLLGFAHDHEDAHAAGVDIHAPHVEATPGSSDRQHD